MVGRGLTSTALRLARSIALKKEHGRLSHQFLTAASTIQGSSAFANLNTFSLAASGVKVTARTQRFVSLVLPELDPAKLFAGIRTALEFGCALAQELELPLRIVVLWGTPQGQAANAVRSYLLREFKRQSNQETQIVPISSLSSLCVADDEIWIGTHWTTAHPLDVACRLGVLRPEQITYLVQDYEPGFFAWSTDFALARATYHAGFNIVVNSSPLAAYLREAEKLEIPDSMVFAPSLDLRRLQAAAIARRADGPLQIMFYGRPSKPRNLFEIGMSALHLAATTFENSRQPVQFVSAGESHPNRVLGSSTPLKVLGKVPWANYFDLLANSDVVLSLQYSPHPSHPPLDAVVSGAYAVTNELGNTRGKLHPRLLVAEADPTELADQIVEAAVQRRKTSDVGFDPTFLDRLGNPIGLVTKSAAAKHAQTDDE